MNNTLAPEIHVGIGEVKTGSSPQILKALLGSCVGIGFIVPTHNTFALAHCLLAANPNPPSDAISARSVEQAVPSLFKLLNLTKWDAPLIQAVIAGGASMNGESKYKILKVGEANIEEAFKQLEKYKVKIIHQDLGLFHGRQLIMNCADGSYSVKELIWAP